jgi:molybdopterin-containing oxidoreductase family membrane subunit
MLLLTGPLAVPFWLFEIGIGLLLPIAILIFTRAQQKWALVTVPLMVMTGMFFARYDFVIAGQLVPVVGRDVLWEYAPHWVEIMTVVGAISLCLLLYTIGNRLLPLEDTLSVAIPVETKAKPATGNIAGVPREVSPGTQ